MRHYLAVAIILFASIAVAPQTAGGPTETEQIENVVDALIARSEKAGVLLKDLTEMSGHVTRRHHDGFTLSSDKKGRTGNNRVRYSDVLAISSKKGSVSFVPDPKTSPYGTWSDIIKMTPNTLIEVAQKNGETRTGRYRSSSADGMVIAHRDKSDDWTLQRANIAFVYRVKDAWGDVSGSMASGTKKAVKIQKDVAKIMPKNPLCCPISGGTGKARRPPHGPAIGVGIGALAGAAKGAIKKSDSVKVLVYSQ